MIISYNTRAWAIAYLVDLTGPNILLDEFHPIVEELGWQEAFESVSNLSLDEFNSSFMGFMEKSHDERLNILKVD